MTLRDGQTESLQIRIRGEVESPTLIYLPGLHGDWTLIPRFRRHVSAQARWVEFTYPRWPPWTLDQYAAAIDQCLAEHQIDQGWLIGESFGSQVVWALVRHGLVQVERGFQIQGIILAGGFVRHPLPWGVDGVHRVLSCTPLRWLQLGAKAYARLVRYRDRADPEVRAGLEEFLIRRTEPDRRAACHRLELIRKHDPRAIAGRTGVPVFYLGGAIDPLVPWPWVCRWLRLRCPGYAGSRIVWFCDHNVLSVASEESARQILDWVRAAEFSLA